MNKTNQTQIVRKFTACLNSEQIFYYVEKQTNFVRIHVNVDSFNPAYIQIILRENVGIDVLAEQAIADISYHLWVKSKQVTLTLYVTE